MGSVQEPIQETPPPEHTRKGKGEKENPTGRKEQLGRGEGQQGLRCGEANPNQRLGGTSGQRPSAGLLKRETEHLCLRQPIHGIGRDP